MKKTIYILLGVIMAGWIGFRVHSIYSESKREVFNAARASHVPVQTITAQEEMGVLREPLFIHNNRSFVSGARIGKFGVGQRVGAGRIVSVASRLDLDTGMYMIKTQGAEDGEQFAEARYTGIMVPIYAVNNSAVMALENGIAVRREVKVLGADSENAIIQRGLNDGDVIILSRVEEGTKVESRK